MKKLTLVIASFLILTVAAWAQGGAGGAGTATQGSSSASQSTNPSNPPDSQTKPDATSTTAGSTHGSMHEKTMEGCIVQQGSDFFLATHNNSKFWRLQGGTDLSAHVGHKVKVHGTEQAAGSASTATPSSPSASETAGAAASTNPATANPSSSSQTGSMPQSSNSSSNITVDPSKIEKKEIMVSSVDMVSDSCSGSPSKNKDKDKNKDTNNPKSPY